MGFDDLRRFGSTDGGAIPIYASRETMQSLKSCFAYAFNGTARFPGYVLPEPHLIEGPFHLGKTEIHPIQVEHGKAHVFGFLFRQDGRSIAAYLSDCKEVPPPVVETVRGVKVAVLDALRREPHPTHMCLDEALTASRRIGADRTFFTHLTHDYDHDKSQAELPPGVELAWDGLKVVGEA